MELKTYALERRAAIHEASHTIAAINFGIPIIRVTIADGQPHLHRGTYRQQRDLAVESLVILCLAGPAGEELICGAVDDGDDRIDVDAARRYLRDDYPDAEIEYQMLRMRLAAERLVASSRRQIEIITNALLRYGSLTGDEIVEL
jgi:hypothetical protein